MKKIGEIKDEFAAAGEAEWQICVTSTVQIPEAVYRN